jgi:hypothetical protein
MDRTKVNRVGGVAFEFLTQPKDVIIDSPRTRIALIPPRCIQQLFARDYALGILRQELEDLELLGSQSDRFSAARH